MGIITPPTTPTRSRAETSAPTPVIPPTRPRATTTAPLPTQLISPHQQKHHLAYQQHVQQTRGGAGGGGGGGVPISPTSSSVSASSSATHINLPSPISPVLPSVAAVGHRPRATTMDSINTSPTTSRPRATTLESSVSITARSTSLAGTVPALHPKWVAKQSPLTMEVPAPPTEEEVEMAKKEMVAKKIGEMNWKRETVTNLVEGIGGDGFLEYASYLVSLDEVLEKGLKDKRQSFFTVCSDDEDDESVIEGHTATFANRPLAHVIHNFTRRLSTLPPTPDTSHPTPTMAPNNAPHQPPQPPPPSPSSHLPPPLPRLTTRTTLHENS
ncbi:hypothetical protein BC829DRAFT_67875 [Chytridium lagenaria]|nr:hypothetical protein BC829DRAFT_67875 [Chytridium lagenaria]